jgi:hypothetical protein
MMGRRSVAVLSLTLLLVAVGIGARFLQFARNNSLFLDECALCLNVSDRSLSGFTRTLEYNEATPLGFLLIQKVIFATAGMNDITSRVMPLIFGVLTIYLMLPLSRRVFDVRTSPCAILLAIGLIALNRGIIVYSALAKQYTLESAITLLLLLALAASIGSKSDSDSRASPTARVLLIASPALLWSSYGAVFIVAGIGAALVARAFVLRRREALELAIYFGLSALVNFVPFYVLSMRPGLANRILAAGWAASYMPLWPPETTVLWLYRSFVSIGEGLIHLRLALFVPLALIVVAANAVRSRSWFWLAAIFSILFCLTAAALRRYPFSGRVLIFLTPVFALIAARLVELIERRSPRAATVVTGVLLAATLVAFTLHGIFGHYQIDNVREPHEKMVTTMQPGDELWVSSLATPCFIYYIRQYPLPKGISVHLLQPSEQAVLRPGRNWFLVMRTPWEPGEGESLLAAGAKKGKEEVSFDVEWTTARLFAIR